MENTHHQIDENIEAVEIPIEGVLDLHSFSPKQVKDVVMDYLDACVERRLNIVRIIHGKGIGTLKRTVHALLKRHPAVVSYHLDSQLFGGEGATIVHLWTKTDSRALGSSQQTKP